MWPVDRKAAIAADTRRGTAIFNWRGSYHLASTRRFAAICQKYTLTALRPSAGNRSRPIFF